MTLGASPMTSWARSKTSASEPIRRIFNPTRDKGPVALERSGMFARRYFEMKLGRAPVSKHDGAKREEIKEL